MIGTPAGNILIEPYTTTTAVSVGSGASALGITTTYLGYLNGGSYTFGNSNDTGVLTVAAYSGWTAPVSFITKSTGSIVVYGNQTSTSTFSFTGPTTLSANLTDTGTTFNSAVTLGANSVITDGSGTAAFDSTVNGDFNLTAAAGTS